MMITINLRDFYYWYVTDVLVEVSDEVAEELMIDKRYEKTHERRMKRNKSISLDVESDLDKVSVSNNFANPETYIFKMEQQCRLCRALNSLPRIQGRRIELHYLLGKSIAEISVADGTGERNVRKSISRGLSSMKIFLKNFQEKGTEIACK